MGLKNITTLLNNKKLNFPEYKVTGWMSDYAGKRVAIDGHGWMYQYMATSQKEVTNLTDLAIDDISRSEVIKVWIKRTLSYIVEFMSYGITPIFVFDGISVAEKDETKKTRRDAKEKVAKEIQELEARKATFNELSIPQDILERLKTLYRNQNQISWDEIEFLRSVLDTIGVPVIQAKGEAEKLCSILCMEGICSGVISADTDCYAFGCPIIIKKLNGRKWNEDRKAWDREITTVRLRDILTILKLNFDEFVDLAIISGCDFNHNAKGYGAIACYDLIKKYRIFKNIPKDEFTAEGIEGLRYDKCKSIFTIVPSSEEIISGSTHISKCDTERLRDTFESVSGEGLLSSFISSVNALPKAESRDFAIDPRIMRIKID